MGILIYFLTVIGNIWVFSSLATQLLNALCFVGFFSANCGIWKKNQTHYKSSLRPRDHKNENLVGFVSQLFVKACNWLCYFVLIISGVGQWLSKQAGRNKRGLFNEKLYSMLKNMRINPPTKINKNNMHPQFCLIHILLNCAWFKGITFKGITYFTSFTPLLPYQNIFEGLPLKKGFQTKKVV